MFAKRRVETVEEKRVIFLILATIPGAIGGLAARGEGRNGFQGAGADRDRVDRDGNHSLGGRQIGSQDAALDAMRWLDALLIGLAQVVALVPGVSRSGSTITAGPWAQLRSRSLRRCSASS